MPKVHKKVIRKLSNELIKELISAEIREIVVNTPIKPALILLEVGGAHGNIIASLYDGLYLTIFQYFLMFGLLFTSLLKKPGLT